MEETYRKVLKKKLHSMRYSKKEVQKETSQDAKQFMYGYTECINDLLEYLQKGGDGLPEHQLQLKESNAIEQNKRMRAWFEERTGLIDEDCLLDVYDFWEWIKTEIKK